MESNNSPQLLTSFIEYISVDQYDAFIKRLPRLAALAPNIANLRRRDELSEAVEIAALHFYDLIESIKRNLSDPAKGIAVIDVPQLHSLSPTADSYWGVSVALSITGNIFRPVNDRINSTPYTIYAASHHNAEKLAKIGLPPVAPETKLGFHTDGLLVGHRVTLPYHIMLYNIAIEYQQPGNFYWIPFSLWEEKSKFMKSVGIGNTYTISVTPSVYETDSGRLETVSPQYVQTPIFVDAPEFNYPLYLNGTVISRTDKQNFDKNIINQMKDSISMNRRRFAIPQKPRRIIFARNVVGAHARDIFQSPNARAQYTRVLLRSVDMNCIELN